MTILTKDQVEALTYKECRAALKNLNREYRLDTLFSELSKEEWAACDDVANSLLWIEDRIARFEDQRVLSMDPQSTTAPVVEEKPASTRQPPNKCSVLGVVYASVKEASQRTGIKETTIRSYFRRYPDKYFFIRNG